MAVVAVTAAAWAGLRISAAAVLRERTLRMLDSRPGFQGSHSKITASSITATIALRSLAGPTPTPPMTAARAGCGRHMDCGGSMSAAAMATDAWRLAQRPRPY